MQQSCAMLFLDISKEQIGENVGLYRGLYSIYVMLLIVFIKLEMFLVIWLLNFLNLFKNVEVMIKSNKKVKNYY